MENQHRIPSSPRPSCVGSVPFNLLQESEDLRPEWDQVGIKSSLGQPTSPLIGNLLLCFFHFLSIKFDTGSKKKAAYILCLTQSVRNILKYVPRSTPKKIYMYIYIYIYISIYIYIYTSHYVAFIFVRTVVSCIWRCACEYGSLNWISHRFRDLLPSDWILPGLGWRRHLVKGVSNTSGLSFFWANPGHILVYNLVSINQLAIRADFPLPMLDYRRIVRNRNIPMVCHVDPRGMVKNVKIHRCQDMPSSIGSRQVLRTRHTW